MSLQNVYTFKEQLAKQEDAFKHFCEWVKSRTNVIGVTVADEIDEKRGIDLWAIVGSPTARKKKDRATGIPNRSPIPIQVKVDFKMHATCNMAVETISKATYDGQWKAGWLSQLHSTRILAYCCGKTGHFRTYRSQDFYQRVMRNYKTYKGFTCINGSDDGGEFWSAMGLLVPVNSMSGMEMNKANLFDLDTGSHELWIGDE